MLLSIVVLGLICVTCIVIAQDTPGHPGVLYSQAHTSGIGDFIPRAFTSEARIEFVDNGELKHWTHEEFGNRFRGRRYGPGRTLEPLNVKGAAASAVLTLD